MSKQKSFTFMVRQHGSP